MPAVRQSPGARQAALSRITAGIPHHLPVTNDSVRRHIAGRIAADYADGRLADANGWLLSRTEADVLDLVRSYRAV